MAVNTVGVIWVDERQNGLGLPSRIFEPFGETTVLAQTLQRLGQCQSVRRWVLLAATPDQVDAIRVQTGDGWEIQPAQSPLPPWTPIVRQCRKWSIDGWRGGLLRTSVLDEECHPAEFARLAAESNAQWIVQVRAESPAVDAKLVDQLVERAANFDPAPPMMYGAIPPGLAGYVYRRDFIEELAQIGAFPGILCGYRAWEPVIELPEQPFALKVPAAVTHIPVRLLADNQRSLKLLRQLHQQQETESAEQIAAALEQQPQLLIPDAPLELEIEVTTQRNLRPGYLPAASRPAMTFDIWQRLIEEYAASSDTGLVTMAGHGDPLLHPGWEQMLQFAHDRGVYGLSLVTQGDQLTDTTIGKLLQSPLDVLMVRLDAHSPAAYQQLYGVDRYHEVVRNLEQYLSRREAAGGYGPRLVVSMVRCVATLNEMEPFYDHWSSTADGALIEPHSDFAGQMPADPVLSLCPPKRRACQRLYRRMIVLSDGRLVSCSQDFAGVQVCMQQTTLQQAWTSDFPQWRQDHETAHWDRLPLCPSCNEWHRP